ncbi:hypothetical protein PBY51_007064 [Eleginops maclovinus]|uniref:Uncharacterized protein n=1 Tax=Eleginops maclovinus TaxID=56733 RepID=A0AAN8AET5_ELEMC|nr:hypothetical protein PBY51_007064 [Eleginops maclovinus]
MLPGPVTSVTRDPCNSCFVLTTPGPSDILSTGTPPKMTDSPLFSLFLPTTRVAFDLPSSTSASPRGCPHIPVKALKPEPCGELIAGPRNQELNDTKKESGERKLRERKGGSRCRRTGLELVLCVCFTELLGG